MGRLSRIILTILIFLILYYSLSTLAWVTMGLSFSDEPTFYLIGLGAFLVALLPFWTGNINGENVTYGEILPFGIIALVGVLVLLFVSYYISKFILKLTKKDDSLK